MKPYSDAFLAAWQAYPHCKTTQRSRKKEAFRVWNCLDLDRQRLRVMRWISHLLDCELGPDYRYSPAMQVWVTQTDFLDEPPKTPGNGGRQPAPTAVTPEHPHYRPPEWWDARGMKRPKYLED